ncbi:MAG: hypothetical protein H6528_03855 [Actinobacteria bacterium]|nr:hypothetical protein [Actinomycetota bacterium]MCB8996417.1 hypothetical protein [Actinomycetota bacterium]MCB9425311.1 hypothetical protein [Actinomycetota bacterium]
MSVTRKVLAVSTTAALASGALFMGAGAANAASDPNFKKVKAPKSATAGQTFILKCKLTPASVFNGADAYLEEKGATINAHRTVSSNGDCSMHVVLNATGKRKIRVVVEQNLGAEISKWVTVNVKPAS